MLNSTTFLLKRELTYLKQTKINTLIAEQFNNSGRECVTNKHNSSLFLLSWQKCMLFMLNFFQVLKLFFV